MKRAKAIYFVLGLILAFGIFGGIAVSRTAFAAATANETLEVTAQFPVLSGQSGDPFDFTVGLRWYGPTFRTFQLAATAPARWSVTMTPQYGDTAPIQAIGLQAGKDFPDSIKVSLRPAPGYTPDPGEYLVTVRAVSGTVSESIELKAVVTARYALIFTTASGQLNTNITAGENNHLAVKISNIGTAVIENITFGSSKPDNWQVTYNPDKIQSIEPGFTQEVDVIITPPRQTIAGDWPVTLELNSTEVSESLQLRVTALTPTIWGWVGVLIVLAVIAGLAVIFWRLGRR